MEYVRQATLWLEIVETGNDDGITISIQSMYLSCVQDINGEKKKYINSSCIFPNSY